jgi:hypothetical protein
LLCRRPRRCRWRRARRTWSARASARRRRGHWRHHGRRCRGRRARSGWSFRGSDAGGVAGAALPPRCRCRCKASEDGRRSRAAVWDARIWDAVRHAHVWDGRASGMGARLSSFRHG